MNKPAVTPVPVAKTLAEQKSDFTAEGSPPPGKVSTSIPASSHKLGQSTANPVPVRATIKLKRPPTAAKP